jgi:hypothetical protein
MPGPVVVTIQDTLYTAAGELYAGVLLVSNAAVRGASPMCRYRRLCSLRSASRSRWRDVSPPRTIAAEGAALHAAI